ncbi:MAG: right-handed parallel beta-helix repeat-containing protein [Nitriliruptorales bacterium]
MALAMQQMLTVLPALARSIDVAEAAALECGTLITEDTVLTADIGPCGDDVSHPGQHVPGGHGLVIGADNVTLDLNGHTIFGLGGPVVLHQAAGVKVNGHSNVTVKNGTVRGFFHGVHVQNGSHNKVVDIRSLDNTTGNGIVLQNVTDSQVMRNTVINSGGFGGISVFDGRATDQLDDLPSARNMIAHNLVDQADNRTTTSGISLENGSDHRVINNTVTNSSGDGIVLFGNRPLPGGAVLPPVTGAQVVNNVVVGNGTGAADTSTPLAGISLRRTVVTGVGADDNKIAGNRVQDNADYGILVASSNNSITGNVARGNEIEDLRDTNLTPPCDANRWKGNKFVTFNQPCVTG